MTFENIVSGFRATELYPLNPDAIVEEAFAPSVFTEKQIAPVNITTENIRSLQRPLEACPGSILANTSQNLADDRSHSEKTVFKDQNSNMSGQFANSWS